MIPKRKMGLGPDISEVGLGTWAIGGHWKFGWGPQDAQTSVGTIEKALETGINWIDTAPAYGLGESEKILARVLRQKSMEIYISTKCGIVWNDSGRVYFDMSPANIRRECEQSLQRLGIDHIDFYQIHWPDNKTLVEDSWKEMLALKKEGKVRYVGLSNFELKLVRRCEKIGHVDFVQLPYSMLKRDAEDEMLPWCVKNQTGFLAYSPMQSGLLTGKFTPEHLLQLPETDWRRRDSWFKEPLFGRVQEFLLRLRPINERSGASPAAMAVAWVLRKAAVTSAIVGARTVGQAERLPESSRIVLSEIDLADVDSIYREIFEK